MLLAMLECCWKWRWRCQLCKAVLLATLRAKLLAMPRWRCRAGNASRLAMLATLLAMLLATLLVTLLATLLAMLLATLLATLLEMLLEMPLETWRRRQACWRGGAGGVDCGSRRRRRASCAMLLKRDAARGRRRGAFGANCDGASFQVWLWGRVVPQLR